MQIHSIFLSILLLAPQQEESLRQIEQRLSDLRQQGQRQEQTIGALSQRADQLSKQISEIRPPSPNCGASLELIGDTMRNAAFDVDTSVEMELFSAIGSAKECAPAEIRLAATYVDAKGESICNGTVEGVLYQATVTQSFVLEVRPWDFENYVRWKPGHSQPTIRLFNRFRCFNDMPADAQKEELDRVSGVRLRVLLLPAGGAMSMREIRIVKQSGEPARDGSQSSSR